MAPWTPSGTTPINLPLSLGRCVANSRARSTPPTWTQASTLPGERTPQPAPPFAGPWTPTSGSDARSMGTQGPTLPSGSSPGQASPPLRILSEQMGSRQLELEPSAPQATVQPRPGPGVPLEPAPRPRRVLLGLFVGTESRQGEQHGSKGGLPHVGAHCWQHRPLRLQGPGWGAQGPGRIAYPVSR